MGGGKKKRFFDKKAATTFNVVHRSQQDGAFGLEDRPSERVLLAQEPTPQHRKARIARSGFADDGYDYERHLSSGGGGVFVSADGGAVSKSMVLPPEALPGTEPELDRAVEAVTLDDRLMDADVRDALFDDAAFEDCEELLDDFVVDASRPADDEPEAFDFDAHVARLIAAAEGGGADADEDGDDASFDAAPPCAHGADDAAFDAALADWSSDDEDEEDEDEELDANRIQLDDAVALDAMLDEAIDARARPEDATFAFHKRDPRRAINDQVSDDEDAEERLDAFYAEEDAAALACEARFDCETVLTTLSNLDNRPSVLGAPTPRRPPPPSRAALRASRLRADADAAEAYAASTASRTTMVSRRGENELEKKARKAETKASNAARRADKKVTKLAWKTAAAEAPVRHAAAPSVFSL